MHIQALVDLIKEKRQDGFTMCEVGCWDGTTTKEYLPFIKEVGGKVYLVDHFCGSKTATGIHSWNPEQADLIYNKLKDNIFPYNDCVEILRGNSTQMASEIADNSLDLCFLDASHLYEDVKLDIRNYFRKVKIGGVFAGHDIENLWMYNTFSKEQLEKDFVRGVHPGVIQSWVENFGNDIEIRQSEGVAPIGIYPIKTKYFEELKRSMEWLAEQDKTVFLGQAVAENGTGISNTLKNISKSKLLEMPVFEETQLGMSIGIALDGLVPISIFPRWNFLLCATNQLINHLDKIPLISDKGYKPKVIIRTAIGSERPLWPSYAHIGDFTEAISKMLTTVNIVRLDRTDQIFDEYRRAYEGDESTILVEWGDYYGEK